MTELPGIFVRGDSCGPYRVDREIGRGGMSIVYLAHSPEGEARAIKVLLPRARLREDIAERFTREVRLLGYLDHVHVVRFCDAGIVQRGSAQLLWVGLEYLEGQTLRQLVRRGPISVDKVIRWGRHIAQGVHQAHRLRVVHRDLKPENVIVCPGDVAKVFDFGIAKYKSWDFQSTAAGYTLGTIAYMAPEQLEDRQEVDARADVYALGLILYELATGHHPFAELGAALDVNAVILRKLIGEAPPLSERAPDLPPDVAAIIERAFAREPADRYASMQELDDALADAGRRRADARGLSILSPPVGAPAVVVPEGSSALFAAVRTPAPPVGGLGGVVALGALLGTLAGATLFAGAVDPWLEPLAPAQRVAPPAMAALPATPPAFRPTATASTPPAPTAPSAASSTPVRRVPPAQPSWRIPAPPAPGPRQAPRGADIPFKGPL